jgi:hypothetical protein
MVKPPGRQPVQHNSDAVPPPSSSRTMYEEERKFKGETTLQSEEVQPRDGNMAGFGARMHAEHGSWGVEETIGMLAHPETS